MTLIKLNNYNSNQTLFLLELCYQNYINKYSPAYLSGSPWYVGTSIIEFINKKEINTDYLALIIFIIYKINKSY
jgi:hypothetical protein